MQTILDTDRFIRYCQCAEKNYELYLHILDTLVMFPSVYFKVEPTLIELCKRYRCPMPRAPALPSNFHAIVCSYI